MATVIEELLRQKKQAGRRPAYLQTLRQYLKRFATAHAGSAIDDLTHETLEEWIHKFPGQQYRATWRNRLSALFSYALRRGYIAQNPCARLEPISVELRPPAIFTVDQCRTVLHFARQNIPRFTAWLALALFAGVRPLELDRLSWEDVDLNAGRLTIDGAASKVRLRRVTPLAPAAIAWLRFGGDLPIPSVTRRRYIRRIRGRLGLAAWPHDVLRHTAASMMLARDQDAGKVALWLGNSPKILLSHYHQLVPDREREEFWRLFPFTCPRAAKEISETRPAPAVFPGSVPMPQSDLFPRA